MQVRLLLLVVIGTAGCQSKPAAVLPAKAKSSLADKMAAAKELAADAESNYRRQAAKLAEYKEMLTFAHGTGNEDSIARVSTLHSQQQSAMRDAKREWEVAEQAVQRLAKQIIEE